MRYHSDASISQNVFCRSLSPVCNTILRILYSISVSRKFILSNEMIGAIWSDDKFIFDFF